MHKKQKLLPATTAVTSGRSSGYTTSTTTGVLWQACHDAVRSQLLRRTVAIGPVVAAYQPQIDKLRDTLAGVSDRHENATILLVGRRGSCKSSVIKAALARLSPAASASASPSTESHVLVELHGSELDDDVVATRELCRQLSAGTTLPRARKASMEHYLRFCMDSLREGRAGNVPVFIVLHDFDLFAKRTKQTLLYNLFDITQSSKYQVCIIGTTTRLDATELLEKRLRSRFSQQQILLDQLDLPAYTEFVRASLQANPATIINDGSAVPFPAKDVGTACIRWNNACDELVGSVKVTEAIRRAWRLNHSLRWLQRWLYMAIVELSAASPLLTADALDAASKALTGAVEPEVEAVGMISHLSPCDLTLVIAMCKLEIGRELATYSFEMAYFEYMKHFKAATGAHRQLSKSVMLKSVERLVSLGVLNPVDMTDSILSHSSADGTPLRYQMLKLVLAPQLVIEAIKKSPSMPMELQRWAKEG